MMPRSSLKGSTKNGPVIPSVGRSPRLSNAGWSAGLTSSERIEGHPRKLLPEENAEVSRAAFGREVKGG
jgi:hypothetical protein